MTENTQKSFSLTAAPCVLVLISGIFLCSFLFAQQSFAAAASDKEHLQNPLVLAVCIIEAKQDYWRGEFFKKEDSVQKSIQSFRTILKEMDKNENPEMWRIAQFCLGAALATLDQLKGSSAHCEEAITAFRAALESLDREQLPTEWGKLHRYFGYALYDSGATKKDIAILKEAISVFQHAIKNLPQGKDTEVWDARAWYQTQYGLGKTFKLLGTLENNPQHLETFIAIYKTIATKRLYHWSPKEWLYVQDTLFFAVDDLGTKYYDDASASSEQKAKGFQLKQESLDIGAAVIQKIASEIPLKEWAGRQLLLGFRYITFSLRCFEEGDGKNAEIKATAALNILQHTLSRITHKELPEEWIKCTGYAAGVLYLRSAITCNLGDLEQAMVYLTSALETVTTDSEKQLIRHMMFKGITETAGYMRFLLPS